MAQTSSTSIPSRPSAIRRGWTALRGIHPALVLATLDLVGLGIASYLSYEELTPGGEVQCTIGGIGIGGCQTVAHSQYSRPFFDIPVAVYGVFL